MVIMLPNAQCTLDAKSFVPFDVKIFKDLIHVFKLNP